MGNIFAINVSKPKEREKWISILQECLGNDWSPPLEGMTYVCSLHFLPSDYIKNSEPKEALNSNENLDQNVEDVEAAGLMAGKEGQKKILRGHDYVKSQKIPVIHITGNSCLHRRAL
ncbi:Hypothetical predicted protein [Cloeon dipterum]|uniref:Uncharacterized protein n=1 Tax=Cloeon dipterum TaxID=197152 RepID=A0A8S1C404_9INSE|nr:Hypothetical predicted protein [Cloeon dipterum]